MGMKVSSLRDVDLSGSRFFAGTVIESPRDSSSTSVLLDGCYILDKRWEKIPGEVSLSIRGLSSFKTGDRLIVKGKGLPISSARNPGDFDFKSYYSLAGVTGRVYLQSQKDVLFIQHNHGFSFMRSVVEPVREFMRKKIRSSMSGEEAALARAMVLGERMGISREVNEQFVNTGTVHILAVSGLHVGFLTAMLAALAAIMRIPRKFRFFVIAPLLIFYAFVVGMTPSIMRAVIMALVILFGIYLQRRSQVINSIGFACLVVLTINPAQFFSPGFQLSFAAVLSIAFFHRRITQMVRRAYPVLENRRFLDSIVSLAGLTVAATLGTVPLTVFYFGRISVVSVFANLLIVPAAGIFAIMTFASIFVGLFSSVLSSLYGACAQLIAYIILTINYRLGTLVFSNTRIPDSRLLFSVLYFSWLAAVVWFGENDIRKKLLLAILLGGDLVMLVDSLRAASEARVFVLDVGQGDAIYAELPDGRNLLVDSGMKFGASDMGERVIAPFLERRGVRKLDYFVITHLHSDHIGGAAFLMRKFRVANFIYPDQISASAMWQSTLTAAKSLKIPTRTAHSGMILDSGLTYRIYVLHPNGMYVGERGSSFRTRFNNGSIVLKMSVGRSNFLFAGDVESEVEHVLVKCYGGFLSSGVIKVGHHGSNTSSSEEFINAVDPDYAVISVGTGNRFGHPSADVLNRLASKSRLVWRTDSLGGAYLKATIKQYELVNWR